MVEAPGKCPPASWREGPPAVPRNPVRCTSVGAASRSRAEKIRPLYQFSQMVPREAALCTSVRREVRVRLAHALAFLGGRALRLVHSAGEARDAYNFPTFSAPD